MKKIAIVFILSCVLSGCAIPFKKSVAITDFREYTEAGFIISTAISGFNYMPIGVIDMEIVEGKPRVSTASTGLYFDPETGTTVTKREFIKMYGQSDFNAMFAENTEYTGIVDEMVKEAKKLGANGILGFSASRVYKSEYKAYVVYANGFAVKIEQ